jgi:D-alanyl-D-alanine carboxypeptidase (penicillin-binding protein 5/6)
LKAALVSDSCNRIIIKNAKFTFFIMFCDSSEAKGMDITMSKKRILRLITFAGITIGCLFAGVYYMTIMGTTTISAGQIQSDIKDNTFGINADGSDNIGKQAGSVYPSNSGGADTADSRNTHGKRISKKIDKDEASEKSVSDTRKNDVDSNVTTALVAPKRKLIYDSTKVNYNIYIPKMKMDANLKTQLQIINPDIKVDAKSAILFDTSTGEILYYKAPVSPVFPASTTKLLNILTALDLCRQKEKVKIGDEITMIASDSTRSNIQKGQVLTVRNLLEAMLLPSGNDAAYALAAYAGRKSLGNKKADKEDAISEFMELMNNKANELNVKNSCFKTPDGYDALGQYTTAYDMGLIGLAAAKNKIILNITKKSKSKNRFVSGESLTWSNTNGLINPNSQWYYSKAFGLKTGTSTMAGRCLIAAARSDEREVLCAVMNSTATGRFADARKLLKYGLGEE